MVNPLRIKRYGQSKLHRSKTDKADAADYGVLRQRKIPAPVAAAPPDAEQYINWFKRLDDLQTAYQQEREPVVGCERDPWVV